MPKVQTRAPIYKIPCGDCEICYTGETERQFATKECEHRKAVEKGVTRKSALAELGRTLYRNGPAMGGGGGGGTPIHKLYGDVPPFRVWFFDRPLINRVVSEYF